MKKYITHPSGICTACGKKPANQWHHKFSRSKWALKLYGPELLDHPKNLQPVCACHASHASLNLIKWDEIMFCRILGIAPRSKLNFIHSDI